MSVSLVAKTGLAVALIGGVMQYNGAPDPATQPEFLERLALRVERAGTLTPQARETIAHVVERAVAATSRRDAEREARRQLAIVRLEGALRAIPDAK
jgi:hypothetical protein